jgi:predicted nucleotidyltransferase
MADEIAHPTETVTHVTIERVLTELERTHNVHIVFAVEAGSRALNLHSPDSDFDVRGLFVPANPSLANLKRALGTHDAPPSDIVFFTPDRMIDVSLWDVRKAVAMLTQGRTAMLEWARSPILYRTSDAWPSSLSAFTRDAGLRTATLRHYTGLLRSMMHHEGIGTPAADPAFDASVASVTHAGATAMSKLRQAIGRGQALEVEALAREVRHAVDEAEALHARATEARQAVVHASGVTRGTEHADVSGMTRGTEHVSGTTDVSGMTRSTEHADVSGMAQGNLITAKKMSYVMMPAVYITWLLQHVADLPPLDVSVAISEIDVAPDVRAQLEDIVARKRCPTTKKTPAPVHPVFSNWVVQVEARAIAALRATKHTATRCGAGEDTLVKLVRDTEAAWQ